jgi:hypothetical protein
MSRHKVKWQKSKYKYVYSEPVKKEVVSEVNETTLPNSMGDHVVSNVNQPLKIKIQERFLVLWEERKRPRIINDIVEIIVSEFGLPQKWIVYAATREVRPHYTKHYHSRGPRNIENTFTNSGNVKLLKDDPVEVKTNSSERKIYRVEVDKVIIMVKADNLAGAAMNVDMGTIVSFGEVTKVEKIDG